MKIAIVGGGVSGVFLAIRLKEVQPSFSITIFEKNEDVLKKMLVTGNGRCNYANTGSTVNKYHNDEFANKLLAEFKPQDLIDVFDSLGIHPREVDNLVFPVSNSASSVVTILKNHLKRLKIKVLCQEEVIDYQKVEKQYSLITQNNKYLFDKIVFAAGGACYPQLGTDGAIIKMLKRHGYLIEPLSPSLSPLKVKENTKRVAGQRARGLVSLIVNNKIVYQEEGEVLFKDEGLSGIVILNMSQKINMIPYKDNIKISLDLAPNQEDIEKEQYIEYVSPKVADYLIRNQLDIHNLVYTFKDFYDVRVAEVSHGGISLTEINDSLESKREKGLYFCGEILDVDGMCGGFNLMFAFASAEKVKKAIGGR
ncbi:MAG TPA: aminoacetone oxidase family FAD-binding enzyme [Erysipelotrichaceae bacterium]|nr:aminoacetone oxidase family FAD-binding enzyme [Erysipelotrichaceae bacterium]